MVIRRSKSVREIERIDTWATAANQLKPLERLLYTRNLPDRNPPEGKFRGAGRLKPFRPTFHVARMNAGIRKVLKRD